MKKKTITTFRDSMIRQAKRYYSQKEWLLFLEARRSIDEDGGPAALDELPLEVPDEQYRELVCRTYSWTSRIWEHRAEWRAIFTGKRRKLESFSSPVNHRKVRGMPDPLVIFRGCCEINPQGFSWTIDRQRAEWFAAFCQGHMNAQKRFIFSGTIAHEHVLAYITSRNEEEIVALPENVMNQRSEDITHLPAMTESVMRRIGKQTK